MRMRIGLEEVNSFASDHTAGGRAGFLVFPSTP